MDFSPKKIKEIAEDLSCGERCYVHRKTGEYFSLIDVDLDEFIGMVGEGTDDEKRYAAIEENPFDYFQVPPMLPYESFKIMEDFAETMPRPLKARLLLALGKRKPFRNFKDIIDGSDYRDEWFAFKDKWIQEYVEGELRFLGEV